MNDIATERIKNMLYVRLNRAAKKNAMTAAMYTTLADVFDDASRDPSIKVVVWHGAGDSFCAGNDLEDFLNSPPGAGSSPQARLMKSLMNFDKPLIAAVQGAVIGGGFTMLLHCDFVYASENARFQLPFVNLALVPEFGSSYLLPRRIGTLRAAELILLGSPFDARHAASLGLVTEVAADQGVLAKATQTAEQLAAKPIGALRASKKLMTAPSREQIAPAMIAENGAFSTQVRSEEAKEALLAFVEKRRPAFGGVKASGAGD